MNTNERRFAKILIACNCWIYLVMGSFVLFKAILTKDFKPDIICGAMLGMLIEMCLIGFTIYGIEERETDEQHD